MTTGAATKDFASRLDQTADDTEAVLARVLADGVLPDEIARPKRLMDAMRYSSLGGGKRLRPFLVVESAAVFGVHRDQALLAGAALECIHCYSLVHDDLPARIAVASSVALCRVGRPRRRSLLSIAGRSSCTSE